MLVFILLACTFVMLKRRNIYGCGSEANGWDACISDCLTCLRCMVLAILHNVYYYLFCWVGCLHRRCSKNNNATLCNLASGSFFGVGFCCGIGAAYCNHSGACRSEDCNVLQVCWYKNHDEKIDCNTIATPSFKVGQAVFRDDVWKSALSVGFLNGNDTFYWVFCWGLNFWTNFFLSFWS